MNTYKITTKVVVDKYIFQFSQTYKGKSFTSVARRALNYIERLKPDWTEEPSQITMRIKRKLT